MRTKEFFFIVGHCAHFWKTRSHMSTYRLPPARFHHASSPSAAIALTSIGSPTGLSRYIPLTHTSRYAGCVFLSLCRRKACT